MSSYAEQVRALVEHAKSQDHEKIIEVECPDATRVIREVMNDPDAKFVVKFRALTLDEMIELGELPPVLMEDLDAFNTAVLSYQLEHMPPEDADEATREQTNRSSVAAAIREQGAAAFQKRTRLLRDATIVLCSVEPLIRASDLEIEDPESGTEMAIDAFTINDRTVMHEAIQKATGDMTTEELKSLAESDQAENADANMAESAGHEPDADTGSMAG